MLVHRYGCIDGNVLTRPAIFRWRKLNSIGQIPFARCMFNLDNNNMCGGTGRRSAMNLQNQRPAFAYKNIVSDPPSTMSASSNTPIAKMVTAAHKQSNNRAILDGILDGDISNADPHAVGIDPNHWHSYSFRTEFSFREGSMNQLSTLNDEDPFGLFDVGSGRSLFADEPVHSTAPAPQPPAAAVISAAPTQPFRLLDLPAELWVRIGKFAVTYPGNILINQDQPTEARIEDYDGRQRCEKKCCIIKRDQPAITKTSHALRNELLPQYYKRNTFHILNQMTTNLNALNWLEAIGKRNRQALDTIYCSTGDTKWVSLRIRVDFYDPVYAHLKPKAWFKRDSKEFCPRKWSKSAVMLRDRHQIARCDQSNKGSKVYMAKVRVTELLSDDEVAVEMLS
ncbi:hypothetical protein AC579_8723 [Pseudocercospora musae]|uniref:Uncharacterized protein n=1 Tax=Pseudocercospora musae TaxID=113226 RepID=A0A139IWH4_9PEZI|nr:hypothetical protein AC579_8723 [Pseudocercospora musae]KXT19034.1 hypothetical protein AC579_8723 [Pseudocercospora musae]